MNPSGCEGRWVDGHWGVSHLVERKTHEADYNPDVVVLLRWLQQPQSLPGVLPEGRGWIEAHGTSHELRRPACHAGGAGNTNQGTPVRRVRGDRPVRVCQRLLTPQGGLSAERQSGGR